MSAPNDLVPPEMASPSPAVVLDGPEIESIPEALLDSLNPLSIAQLKKVWEDQRWLVTVGAGLVVVIWAVWSYRSSSKRVGVLAGAGRTRRKAKNEKVVVFIGLPDSGKTAVFTKLAHRTLTPTHTSLLVNSSILPPSATSSGKRVTLIDVPGHPRLRDKLEAELKNPDVEDAIMLVDVSSILKDAGNVAEVLSSVMISMAAKSASVGGSPDRLPRLLITAHKADLLSRTTNGRVEIDQKTSSLAIERVKNALTKELSRLKASRSSFGGKIEGMSAVPTDTSSRSGLAGRFFSGRTSRAAATTGDDGDFSADLEAAEAMIWGDGRKSDFSWNEVEGIELEWIASGLPAIRASLWDSGSKNASEPEKETGTDETEIDDGLDQIRDWLDRL